MIHSYKYLIALKIELIILILHDQSSPEKTNITKIVEEKVALQSKINHHENYT